MNVDTSKCNFTATPAYFTSVSGVNMLWDLIGHTSVYSATPNSFAVYTKYVAHLVTTSAQMKIDATSNKWNLNCLGILE